MLTIVDYNAGNLTSVQLAFEHLGHEVLITSKPADILAASRAVFPGVGAARAAMENLRRMELLEPIRTVVDRGTPFLGICIGMQLLFESSEENDGTTCIGLLPGTVKRFRPSDPLHKIPQIGWNAVSRPRPHPLFDGIDDASEFYFVHSYYPCPADENLVIGKTDYADALFASAVARDNLAATQFHPERSGRIGMRLLDNFAKWNGK